MARKIFSSGTDNVLLDLGLEDADQLSSKALLAMKINELVDRRSLSQSQVAGLIGMSQPKVSQIRNYKLLNISLERLMHALVSLDQRVEISVRPARRPSSAGISVSA